MMSCSPNSSGVFNYHSLNVYVAGDVGNQRAKITRIVHISDTRGAESCYLKQIPKGDILIHSGDFFSSPIASNWRDEVARLNKFFRSTQYRYKVFVPGCWDFRQENRPCASEIQKELTEAIYLEDKECKIMGLSIYGLPWISADDLRSQDCNNNHVKRNIRKSYKKFRKKPQSSKREHDGFVLSKYDDLIQKYRLIPKSVDICISHSPAWRQELSDIILNDKKPVLLLSGHDFSSYGVMWRKGILFSNAALQLSYDFPLIPHSTTAHQEETRTEIDLNHNPIEQRKGDDATDLSLISFQNEQKIHHRRPPRWKRKLQTKLMNTPTILAMDTFPNYSHDPSRNGRVLVDYSYAKASSQDFQWNSEPTLVGRLLSRFCCLFLRRKEFVTQFPTHCDDVIRVKDDNNPSRYSTTQSSIISLEQTPTSEAALQCSKRDVIDSGVVVEPIFVDSSSYAFASLSMYRSSRSDNNNGPCSSVSAQPRGPIVFDFYHEIDSLDNDILPIYSSCLIDHEKCSNGSIINSKKITTMKGSFRKLITL